MQKNIRCETESAKERRELILSVMPGSAKNIAFMTDIPVRSVQKNLIVLEARREAHIYKTLPVAPGAGGTPTAVWRRGAGPDPTRIVKQTIPRLRSQLAGKPRGGKKAKGAVELQNALGAWR